MITRAIVGALAILALVAMPAAAQSVEPWEITNYDVLMQVETDGDVLVVERIDLDFGTLERRGIFRWIPLWDPLPDQLPPDVDFGLPAGADPGDYQRELQVDAIQVESPSGAPGDAVLEGPSSSTNGNLRIRIGDADIYITGGQTYVIRYRVRGALNAFTDHDELYWDAIGEGWPVPIRQASVSVRGPGVQSTACFQGVTFSVEPCDHGATASDEARFASSRPLQPFEGMSIVVGFEPGLIDVPPPTIGRKPGPYRAMLGHPLALPTAVVLGVLGLGFVGLLGWREGRDRVATGSILASGQFDPGRAAERRKGLFEPQPVPVEYRPPDDLPPALLGLIIDEKVDPADVSATIVDLAVRGHLHIQETQKKGWLRRADWKLVKDPEPSDEANSYERLLLDGLFDGRVEVEVSDLKGTFAKDYQKVESEIYQSGQRRKWFAGRPDHARTRWAVAGVGLAVAGVVATFLLASRDLGAVGLPIVLSGITLAILAPRMPRRTAKGSAMLTQTLGFKEFVEQAETERMEFAEAENLFVKYLPYAMMFGAVDKWAQAFEAIGIDPGEAVGRFYGHYGAWNLMHFSSGMNEFSSAVGQGMATPPPSSSSGGGSGFGGGGFSGGGGGGGGGGSW